MMKNNQTLLIETQPANRCNCRPRHGDQIYFSNLPEIGLLRINQVLPFVPVSRSSWWQGVREGRYPKPIKLSPRVTAWRTMDIRTLIEGGEIHD